MYEVGRDEYISGNFAEAINYLDVAIKLNPNYAPAYFYRGSAKTELQSYSSAIADITKAIDIDPNYTAAYNHRGLARIHQGDYFEAISDFDKAVELDPKFDNAYGNRGVAEDFLRNSKTPQQILTKRSK
jgi:tetratricopeptide (TPR) repeat protein